MKHKLISTLLMIVITTIGSKAQNSMTMNKQTNSKAPVKCTKTISIKASPERVWQVLTDINSWAKWQTAISKPELKGPLQVNSEFVWKTGGAKINSTLHTVDPYKAFGWTGKTFGMFAIHNWTIVANKDTTTVTVDETMEGFLAGLFKRSFNKNLEKGMIYWLDVLKVECEK